MAGKSKSAAPQSGVQADGATTVVDTTAVDAVAGTVVDTTAVDAAPGTVVETTAVDAAPGTVVETTAVDAALGTVVDTTTTAGGEGFNLNTSGTISVNGDVTATDGSGTVVPEVKMENIRRPVVFLGPHHRYSRGDTACFDSEYAQELVARRIAVWPEDAKRALNPRKGDDDHATDIG